MAVKPCIERLIFMKDNVEAIEEKIVALLHRTIEDINADYKFLIFMFRANIAQYVSVLSKEKNENYFDYIRKVKGPYIAKNVKIADLKHNMDLTRLHRVENKDLERLEKYKKSMKILKDDKDKR